MNPLRRQELGMEDQMSSFGFSVNFDAYIYKSFDFHSLRNCRVGPTCCGTVIASWVPNAMAKVIKAETKVAGQ